MNRAKTGVLLTLVLALAGLLWTPPAQAQLEPDSEEIVRSLVRIRSIGRPTVIDRAGHYVLARRLVVGDETAIEIRSDNVTLDLGGQDIIGPEQIGGVGVSVIGASNVKITNGHLQRIGIGVLVQDSVNVVVEGVQVNGFDRGGAPPEIEIGVLLVNSRGCRVVDNVITRTFLGIFVRGAGSAGNYIAGNVITGGDNGELGICYNPAPDAGGVGGPQGDLITGNLITRYRRGFSFSADSAGNVLRGNTLAYFDLSIEEATAGSNLIQNNDETQISR